MANEPVITIAGNLTGDPELRFTPSGAPVANLSVAVTPRVKNGDQWEDGETTFYRCAVWRQMAENVAGSLTKGQRVIVTGRFKTRTYQTRDGADRLSLEIDVDEIGPSLRYGETQYRKTAGQQQDGRRPQQQPPVSHGDPWGGQQQPQQRPPENPWAGQQQSGQRPSAPPQQYAQQPPPQQQLPQQPAMGDPWADTQQRQYAPPQQQWPAGEEPPF